MEKKIEKSFQLATIAALQKRIDALELAVLHPRHYEKLGSINRTEICNGEQEVPPREESRAKMCPEDKIDSMRNAMKILPPNLIKNGRHHHENVQALCGFLINEEMMDQAYAGFKHDTL